MTRSPGLGAAKAGIKRALGFSLDWPELKAV
jgi:hypothetical protein